MKALRRLFAALLLLSATVANAITFEVDGIYYYLLENLTAGVSHCSSSSFTGTGAVTIPATVTYDGIPVRVTLIGGEAFRDCRSLTSITIPEGVTYIGELAFSYCINLTAITIPESVTSIGRYAFQGCRSLASITLPEKVTSIGEGTFTECRSLTSITIPEGVTSIGEWAFSHCTNLTSIVIPESVTTIGNGAFCDCNSLQKVIIPKYVTSIGQSAFKSCSSLAAVVSLSTVAPTIGYDCFLDINSDAILYNLPESDYSAWEPYFSSTSTLSYYLRHVKTGFFMTSGAYWGTCAVLGETGIDMTVTPLPNGRYTIDTQIFNGSQHHLGSNGYVDAERTEWIIEAQSEGLYTMSTDGTHYFGSTEGTNVLDFSCTDSSTEGALWEFVDKKDLIAELNGASVTAPINATFLIPGGSFNVFDSRNANWQGSPDIGGYRDSTRANYCAEKYNTSFDVYQDFAGLPNGLYKVRVQGFYRMGSARDAATNRQLGTEVLNASLYANEESCSLMSIFEGATTTIGYTYGVVAGTEYGKIPNDMESAASFFTDGKFWNEVWVIVTNGTLRIGVKKNELVKDDWACFDNFELHYYGANQPVIGVSLDRTSAKIIEGESLTLTATLIPSDATDVITWSSSDSAVATVDTNGTVTAKSLGTAIITAKVGEYAATCEVEVVGYYFTDSSFEHLVITNDYDYLSSDSYPWDDYRARIKTVEIKNGVTEIGCYAFEGCSSLQSITIPESVNSIEQAAFRRCSSLNSIIIPEGVTSIRHWTFEGCSSLQSITIPKSVTSIIDRAFFGCSSLKSIIIPESVTSIGRYAFNSCSSLQSITIPERVNSIGEGAFNNCSSLAEVKSLSTTAPTIGPGCFSQIHSGATLHYPAISDYSEWWKSYFSNRKVIHYYFRNYLRHLVIIGDYNDYFSSDSYPWHNVRAGIETIEIKNGVTGIGNYEFADCSSLQSIIIPESVNSIGQAAFQGCSSLQSITIPESVTSIGEYAFKSCSSLAAVTSQSTTAPTIGPECFSDINSNAILYNPPGSDYSAWEPYFSSVLNPATKITLDQNVVTITEGEILTLTATITPDDAIDKAVTCSSSDESVATVINGLVTALAPGTAAITAQVEDKTATCVVTVEKRIIPVSSISLNRTSADIEGGETLVLTAAVSPNNATYNTVIWSSSNTSVAIVDNNGKVIGVGSGTAIITAKAGEKSATCEVKVTIPVSSISLSRTYAALAGDESITLTATVSPDNATYKTVTWSSSNEDVAIVDNGKVTARSAGVATITATADGVTAACEVNVNGWKFDNVTGHLFVNDVIDCKYYTSYPWYEISGNVLSVEFGDQATTIGKEAFVACASLMTVTMSDSVKSIGDEAFYECIGLMSVEFSNNLESIGDYAFAQCVGLTSIDIPNSISNIQNYAFTDCDGLINVFIPSSVTNIGNGAFADCDGLSSIVIPSSVITIGSNTFSNCDGLTSIVIPNSVKTIAGSAFQGCSMLNKLVVGNGVGIIGVSAFEGCEKLKTVINFSNLDIVKGATTHGYVAYYADIVVTDGLALNQTTLELTTGESAILTAIVASGDNNAVTWSSSNEDIATVNNGEVTALAAGTTTITAKTGDYEATCVVTVTQKFITVSNITLSHTEVALTEGETLTLKATVSPDDATDKTVTWSSSDESVATIIDGVVTALAAGTATITAKAGDYEATCVVTVEAEKIVDLDMTHKVGTSKEAWHAPGNPVNIDGITMPENYQESASTLGEVLWQQVEGLENGKYTVELWANARVAWRESPATDGQEELTYLYANNVEISMKVLLNPGLNTNATYVLKDVEVTDGTMKIGMVKKAAGSNWHTIQIKSLTLHATNAVIANIAKVDLKAALDAANAVLPKKDDFVAAIAAAQNVYDNSKDAEEVKATVASLKAATKLAILMNATEENPVLTDFVVNGTFDAGTTGWKSTTGAQNQGTATNQQGAFTGAFFENWNPNNYTGKLYQVIENVPNGIYELSICAFVETFDASAQFVYANGDKVALTTGAPTAYKVRTIVDNNTIEVGFEQTVAVNRWCGIDNVSLTYLGEASNEAVVNAAKKAFTAAYEEFGVALTACQAMMLKMSFYEIDDAAYQLNAQLATTTDVDALNTMAETLDEATAALKEINEVYAGYDAFVQKFKAAAEISEPMTTEAAELLEYNMSGGAGMQAASLEALAQAVETIKADYFTYIANANLLDGNKFDLTFMIQNPGFEMNLDGWTGVKANRIGGEGYDGVGGIAEIGEWGASSWDASMSQAITNLPNGKYVVKAAWMAATGIQMTFAANAGETTVTGIGDMGGNIAKDGSVVEMGQGHRGWQYVEVEGLVEDGTLTISVSSSSAAQYMWSNADAFELYYAGSPESTGIESSVLEAQGSQPIYDLHGRRVENPTKGIYIVNGKKVVIR